MFGNSYICPVGIDMDTLILQCRYFMGDRWVVIGPIEQELSGPYMQIVVPGLASFMQKQEFMQDGTPEWLKWGPRLN